MIFGCLYICLLGVVCLPPMEMSLIAKAVQGRFPNPGTYISARVWANAWDVCRHTPSRGGGGGRDPPIFLWCVFNVAVCHVFIVRFCFIERTRPASSLGPPCLIYLSTTTVVVPGRVQTYMPVCCVLCMCSTGGFQ